MLLSLSRWVECLLAFAKIAAQLRQMYYSSPLLNWSLYVVTRCICWKDNRITIDNCDHWTDCYLDAVGFEPVSIRFCARLANDWWPKRSKPVARWFVTAFGPLILWMEFRLSGDVNLHLVFRCSSCDPPMLSLLKAGFNRVRSLRHLQFRLDVCLPENLTLHLTWRWIVGEWGWINEGGWEEQGRKRDGRTETKGRHKWNRRGEMDGGLEYCICNVYILYI